MRNPSSKLYGPPVFDTNGREVTSLINEFRNAGRYKVIWDSESAPAGVYLCRMNAGGFVKTKRLTLIK